MRHGLLLGENHEKRKQATFIVGRAVYTSLITQSNPQRGERSILSFTLDKRE